MGGRLRPQNLDTEQQKALAKRRVLNQIKIWYAKRRWTRHVEGAPYEQWEQFTKWRNEWFDAIDRERDKVGRAYTEAEAAMGGHHVDDDVGCSRLPSSVL